MIFNSCYPPRLEAMAASHIDSWKKRQERRAKVFRSIQLIIPVSRIN